MFRSRQNDVVEPALDAPIVEDNFKVNIYRARAVEVIDGANKSVVQTASTSPKLAAKEAGLVAAKRRCGVF